jgi:hypothetical protein
MPKTTIGLFEDPGVVGDVVREIEALGLPRNEVRTLDEPSMFDVTGVMSFARLDFEVDSVRELTRIGATEAEAQAYVEGLRHGGILVFATGSDREADAAAEIMRRSGAVEIEETSGPEPQLPIVTHASMVPIREGSILAGRFSQPDSGACVFVW